MATDQPYLTLAWWYLGHFNATWTHSGTDIFGWYIEAWYTGTSTYIVNRQSSNTAQREETIPGTSQANLLPDVSVSVRITALSASGHVASRVGTIVNGHQVTHTCFDGPVYIWPKHDLPIDGSHFFLCEQEISHIGDFTFPPDFLPATAIPLALATAIRYRVIAHADGQGWDHKRAPNVWLFGRPAGYQPDWSVGVKYSAIAAYGAHASGEWNSQVGPPNGWVGDTYSNDFINAESTWRQSDYPSQIDPATGTYPDQTPWTRANLMGYRWGFGWWASVNDDTSTFQPIPGVYQRCIINEGQIDRFKVHVDYALPATYDDDVVLAVGGVTIAGGQVFPPTAEPLFVCPIEILIDPDVAEQDCTIAFPIDSDL